MKKKPSYAELEIALRESEERYRSIVKNVAKKIEAEETLRMSEERYRNVVEAQTELICRWQSDCTLTFVNDAYCHFFGKSRSELLGKNFLTLIPEGDHETVLKHFSSLSQEQPVLTHEHKVVLPSGKVCWHQWTNLAIFDERGQLVEIQAVGVDITEQKQSMEALLNAKNSLEFQVEKRAEELATKSIILREIIDQIELEKVHVSERVRANVEKLILPVIEKLKGQSSFIDNRYLKILEQNIKEITSSFGISVANKNSNLTPKEIEICSLIKSGFTGKEIANMQNLSFKTIASHRYNIRKKLGISSKKINLASWLRSL